MFWTLVVLARLYSVQGETPKLHQHVEAGKLCNSSLNICVYISIFPIQANDFIT